MTPNRPSRIPPSVRGLMWLAAFVTVAGATYHAVPPWMMRRISWAQEARLARALPPPQLGAVCDGGGGEAPGARALQRLGRRLYPLDAHEAARPLDLVVVHHPAVNAVTGLGGRVVVFSGLIEAAKTPEELAGVLAHEFAHVARRHVLQALASQFAASAFLFLVTGGALGTDDVHLTQALMNLQFTEEHEEEADRDALRRLASAHVSATGLADFFARQARTQGNMASWLSDHPSSLDREARARAAAGATVGEVLSPAEWLALKALCTYERTLQP